MARQRALRKYITNVYRIGADSLFGESNFWGICSDACGHIRPKKRWQRALRVDSSRTSKSPYTPFGPQGLHSRCEHETLGSRAKEGFIYNVVVRLPYKVPLFCFVFFRIWAKKIRQKYFFRISTARKLEESRGGWSSSVVKPSLASISLATVVVVPPQKLWQPNSNCCIVTALLGTCQRCFFRWRHRTSYYFHTHVCCTYTWCILVCAWVRV